MRLRREGTAIGHEARPLRLEHLPDRSLRDLGVAVGLRPRRAAVGQPGVELLVALRPNPGREEAAPDHAHLVLDLSLLPAGGGRAGHGFDQVVTAHLLEAAVVGALPAREDRVDRRLRSAGDPSTGRLADPPRCRRCPGCRPRRRRRTPCRGRRTPSASRLARIGPHEHHPAVAEADVRDLHRRRGAVDHHDLVAPVELVCLARGEASCRRRAFRATARRPPPSPRSPGASSRPRSGARRHSRRRSRALAAPRRSASASAAPGSVAQRSQPAADPARPAKGRSSAGAGSSARRKTPSRPSGSPCAPSSAKPAAPGRSP